MNAAAAVSFRDGVLPWAAVPEDEARFRRLWRRVLGACLLLGLALPWLPVSKPEREPASALPPPVARLLPERAAPTVVPAPPRAEPPAPRTELAETPAELMEAPAAVATAPAAPEDSPSRRPPVPEAREPQAGTPPGEAAPRRRAAGMGLLAMKEELAELRGAPLAARFERELKPGPGVGSGSGPGVGAGREPGLPSRSLVTADVGVGSGGINTAAFSRDAGGGGLPGRSTTLVEGVPGGGGGGGPGVGGGGRGDGPGAGGGRGTAKAGAAGKASRSIEEIKLVFERNKGAIYALYNRALRDDPSLQGKVVLELKIAPDGAVTACRVVSSELRASELERKLLARIRQFDFGAKDVELMVVSWPVDFLPS